MQYTIITYIFNLSRGLLKKVDIFFSGIRGVFYLNNYSIRRDERKKYFFSFFAMLSQGKNQTKKEPNRTRCDGLVLFVIYSGTKIELIFN